MIRTRDMRTMMSFMKLAMHDVSAKIDLLVKTDGEQSQVHDKAISKTSQTLKVLERKLDKLVDPTSAEKATPFLFEDLPAVETKASSDTAASASWAAGLGDSGGVQWSPAAAIADSLRRHAQEIDDLRTSLLDRMEEEVSAILRETALLASLGSSGPSAAACPTSASQAPACYEPVKLLGSSNRYEQVAPQPARRSALEIGAAQSRLVSEIPLSRNEWGSAPLATADGSAAASRWPNERRGPNGELLRGLEELRSIL
mmetsp:Transcript_20447/g.54199  ORF Transcript_20447/g.54199 Transcript_20447/m.54199 type:complete len:257 (+) Transcript_20447:3-773(+)